MAIHHIVETTLELTLREIVFAEIESVLMFDRDGRLIEIEIEDYTGGALDVVDEMKRLTPGSAEHHFCLAILSTAKAWLETDDGIAAEQMALVEATRQAAEIGRAVSRSLTLYDRDVT